MRQLMRTAVLAAVLAPSLSACWVEKSPDGFTVVNETDRPVELQTDDGARRELIANGGYTGFVMEGCSDSRLEARWPDGTVVAVLDEEYCTEQTWTITGPDESTLE